MSVAENANTQLLRSRSTVGYSEGVRLVKQLADAPEVLVCWFPVRLMSTDDAAKLTGTRRKSSIFDMDGPDGMPLSSTSGLPGDANTIDRLASAELISEDFEDDATTIMLPVNVSPNVATKAGHGVRGGPLRILAKLRLRISLNDVHDIDQHMHSMRMTTKQLPARMLFLGRCMHSGYTDRLVVLDVGATQARLMRKNALQFYEVCRDICLFVSSCTGSCMCHL